MASFVFVLLLPVLFFVHSLFQNSWHQVEQKMLEKHQLISKSLIEPFTLFVSTRQHSLLALGQELNQLSNDVSVLINPEKKEKYIQHILDRHQKSFGSFVALSYSSKYDSNVDCISTTDSSNSELEKPNYSQLTLTKLPPIPGGIIAQDMLSPAFKSTISNKPVVLIRHEILNKHSIVDGIIYAEVSLDQISSICSKINFGKLGHCAIVDQTGHVVAHPKKDWVLEVKDLSKVSVVQKMLAGESGTTEFFSPALKADMVAGFSAIPALGWGVMIPQPKSELTKTLGSFRLNTLVWLAFGVLVALLVSGLLTRKITRPIQLLIKRTGMSESDPDMVSLGEAPRGTPAEINQLWASFSALLAGLQDSNKEIKRLNKSLQQDIDLATTELREMNKHLYKTSTQDYLTSLSNRRHFTHYLNEVLSNNLGESIGIIVIDIDKFKHINDHFGHEAGDIALVNLTKILKKNVRPQDLLARLGGDEFIVYVSNPTEEMIATLAEKIRSSMEHSTLQLSNQSLRLTLSIGTVVQQNNGELSTQALLRFADQAMYHSKTSGRNQVSAHNFETNKEEKEEAALS